ncbi:hypothetical protein [Geminocystis sp. GBBB08]|uniref:hypothetical protein n=1 Tax=Geminocystis sp. GBBB08 TaxID=2604140 RepID=UPI0027E3A2B7|nr:hypothetical protein [Geminocystis sp. GBBB08]
MQPSRGVKINSIYYWSNFFRNPQVENTSIPIRYDPFNIGIAYAFVEGQWVECISQYYSEFQGHTEKELKLITNELRKSHSQNNKQSKISAKKLAEFLYSVEAEEILLEQRLHDAQALDVFQIIDGGKTQSEKVTDIQAHKQKKTLLEHPQDSQESINQNINPPSLVVYEEF